MSAKVNKEARALRYGQLLASAVSQVWPADPQAPSAANHDPGDEDRSVDSYCENCGDPYDMPSAGDPLFGAAYLRWRPCPNPSPGRPLVDCGIGGHMYVERKPRPDVCRKFEPGSRRCIAARERMGL